MRDAGCGCGRFGGLVDLIRHNQSPLFELHDFTTPARFGGDDWDFVNAAHIGAANADLLLRGMLAGESHRARAG